MVTFGPGVPDPGLDPGFPESSLPDPGGANLALPGRTGVTTGQLLDRADDREAVVTGWPALDRLLPGGGVRRGSLIEWLAGAVAATDAGCVSGAATLACAIACRLAATRRTLRGDPRGGLIVVVDRAGWFHPPAVLPWLGAGAAATGRLVVARPSRDDDEIWTVEQALRCAGVAAVVAWPRLVTARSSGRGMEHGRAGRGGLRQWTTAMRRWQLAARSVGAVGLFVRSPAAIDEPSWAESRLAVSPLPGGSLLERRLRITRVGGAWCGAGTGIRRPAEIVIDLARGSSMDCATAGKAGMSATRCSAAASRRALTVAEGGASCRAS